MFKQRNVDEALSIARQLDEKLGSEFEKLVEEMEKGYEKEDALFLLLSYFKKLKRSAETLEGERKRVMLRRIKNAFVRLAFDAGVKKKELGRYLKELRIYESREERVEKKKEELEKIRRAVTTEEVRKRIKPRVVQPKASEPELTLNELLMLLLLFLLLLHVFFRLF